MRDIDQIIQLLKVQVPGTDVEQLRVLHPGADDDGLWFIKVPNRSEQIQLESSEGICPFIVESDAEVARGHTVEEVVATVRRLFGI